MTVDSVVQEKSLNPRKLLWRGISLLIAFGLIGLMLSLIDWSAFWDILSRLSATSLIAVFLVYMLLNFFLSGHMFPLDMLPTRTEPWGWLPGIPVQGIVKWLPFAYLAYHPPAILLGKVPSWKLSYMLATQVLWVAFFGVLSRLLYLRGLRRYGGYGG